MDSLHKMNPLALKVGNIVRVFDDKAWRKAGGDQGDNSQFYKPAIIIEINTVGDTATVFFFDKPPRLSFGHFLSAMKPIRNYQVK